MSNLIHETIDNILRDYPEGDKIYIHLNNLLRVNRTKWIEDNRVKRGKWIECSVFSGVEVNTYYCSVCGDWWTLDDGTPQENNMNFCPKCGADMREKLK